MNEAFAITPVLESCSAVTLDTARARRDQLLAEAVQVESITDQIDADAAAATLQQLKTFSKDVAAAHKDAKAPVLELSRQIDELLRDLVTDVKDEADRIGRILGAYDAEQRRQADEKRRQAEAEAARIRYEAEQKARAEARTADSPEDAARKADEILGGAASQVADLQAHAEAQKRVGKRAGMALKTQVEFEVTDINALHKENPTLVILEPNKAAIKAILKSNPNIQIPGLRHWTVEKF